MDLSKIPEYRNHMRLFLAGKYELAERCLMTCLTDHNLTLSQQSHIHILMADVIWESGDKIRAIACLDKSEQIDPTSPQPMLSYAKFLVHVGENEKAKDKCHQILDRIKATDYIHDDNDLSIEYYERETKAVLSQL